MSYIFIICFDGGIKISLVWDNHKVCKIKTALKNCKKRGKEEKEEMFLPYYSLIIFLSQVSRSLD